MYTSFGIHSFSPSTNGPREIRDTAKRVPIVRDDTFEATPPPKGFLAKAKECFKPSPADGPARADGA